MRDAAWFINVLILLLAKLLYVSAFIILSPLLLIAEIIRRRNRVQEDRSRNRFPR